LYGGWKLPGYLCHLGKSFNVVNQVPMGVGYVSASLCEANGKRPFPPGGQVNTHIRYHTFLLCSCCIRCLIACIFVGCFFICSCMRHSLRCNLRNSPACLFSAFLRMRASCNPSFNSFNVNFYGFSMLFFLANLNVFLALLVFPSFSFISCG
jgi:hypothetical protein